MDQDRADAAVPSTAEQAGMPGRATRNTTSRRRAGRAATGGGALIGRSPWSPRPPESRRRAAGDAPSAPRHLTADLRALLSGSAAPAAMAASAQVVTPPIGVGTSVVRGSVRRRYEVLRALYVSSHGPVLLRLIRHSHLICEVSDTSSTSPPHLRQARSTDEGGRGLFLVAQPSERWGTCYGRDGKTIWAEQPLSSQ
ncbi:hypothetical protein AMK31_37760 [Streptomyces sp. TSRI0107]|nr:hypothetical protein AMK31_37760 [Streptomyces sp. TSRI0107]